MSFQDIRGALEQNTLDALTSAGVTATDVFFDGVGLSRPAADSTWAQVSISFTDIKQDLIGCDGGEDIRGTVQCNIYSPEDQGSRTGEDIAAAVLKAWSGTLKWDAATRTRIRCRNLDGPRAIANNVLQSGFGAQSPFPHRCHVVSAAFNGTAP
jgi:hypothetical protein